MNARINDQRPNDAVWARFYRDAKTIGAIAAEFGGSLYDYSPWLIAPLLRGDQRQAYEFDALRSENERLRQALAVIAARPADEPNRTNWDAIVWEHIAFAREALGLDECGDEA